ncbi:uncharacterized protein LOC107620354 [Arachis ipaensis]|uniref:uncharacterized protein LOC107620354 n=1 Tax=Arachis ipaensis TaxID=130454 RepID=UPI0007AF24ED|nr:uncharacterized protein LOC107620354 [Arachis ipaensis]
MTITEYTNKFKELCWFFCICQCAPEDFVEWKCIKYEGGLQSDILSSVGTIEIKVFFELVNKSRAAEECLRKAVVERRSQRMPFQRAQGRNFTPRGRNFKRGGFVPQYNQGQSNYRRPNNTANQGRRYGKQLQTDLSCQRCGKYHLGVPYKLGSGGYYFCGQPGHLAWNCPEKKKYKTGRVQQPERVFTTSAASAKGSKTLNRGNCEVAGKSLTALFDSGATNSFIAFDKASEIGLKIVVLGYDLKVHNATSEAIVTMLGCPQVTF